MKAPAESYVRRHLDRRPLTLKIRVVTPSGLTRAQVLAALANAIETRQLPPGYVVRWIDWRKGVTGQVDSGRLTDDLMDALKDFYGAITKGKTRVARVGD